MHKGIIQHTGEQSIQEVGDEGAARRVEYGFEVIGQEVGRDADVCMEAAHCVSHANAHGLLP